MAVIGFMMSNPIRKVVCTGKDNNFLLQSVRSSIKHLIKMKEAHMKLQKKLVVLAAAGALSAATALPAMAFENEFHGIYNLKYFVSNVENGGTINVDPTAFADKNKANNYFEQRFRLLYTAKASDDLKLVSHFELDTKFGGDKTGKYGVSSDAGVFDADGIMLETKWVYLDFNLGKSVNVKTGIQPIKDSAKGIFLDADATGILVKSTVGALTSNTGYFRVATESSTLGAAQPTVTSYFTNTSQIGHANKDIFVFDNSYAVNKDVKVGLGYYLLADYSNLNTTVHMADLNAEAKIGPATISGFVAAETGYTQATATLRKSVSAFAGNVAAKVAVGPGTAKTAFLFTSGDGDTNNHVTAWQNTGIVTYAEGGMLLLARTGVGGTTTDRTIIGTVGAGNKGVWLYTLGYDATITPKFYTNVNAGAAWVAKNAGFAHVDKATGKNNASNYLGTEINLETGYKIYDNLTAKLQAGYLILGGAYQGTAANGTAASSKDPENLYTVRTALSYAF
jgi:hypothetical protein